MESRGNALKRPYPGKDGSSRKKKRQKKETSGFKKGTISGRKHHLDETSGEQQIAPKKFKPNDGAEKGPETGNSKYGADAETPSCSGHTRPNSLTIERLIFHRELGRGAYGKVMLAEDTVTKNKMAVKIVKKKAWSCEKDDEIMIECRVLELANESIFFTHIYDMFQTKNHLYFAMEYAAGGNLKEYLDKKGKLDISTTKFFAAEMVCGIEFLHSKGIIHRDLKPENILLDSAGHIKIADFGLALENMQNKTATGFAGTLGYAAPEMLSNNQYNHSVDWWSFGVILYEMATGWLLFDYGQSSSDVISCVLKEDPVFPENLDITTLAIIKKLLCKDPHRRLTEPSLIRLHPFFYTIDWEELQAGRLVPPSQPQSGGKEQP